MPNLDRYTQLRQMGYSGTEAEMLEKYYDDTSGLDTIGERLGKALDEEMARTIIGVTSDGGALVAVPNELSATGTPSATTYLRGDGTWATPAASSVAWGNITGIPTSVTNIDTLLAGKTDDAELAALTATVNTKVDTATVANMITAALASYTGSWLTLTQRPNTLVEIECPNDIQLPANYPGVSPGTAVASRDKIRWFKKTAPSVNVARVGDRWVPRDF